MGAVKNAMQRDGLEPSIMDLDPGRSVVSQLKAEGNEKVDMDPPLKNDPTYRCVYVVIIHVVFIRLKANSSLFNTTANTSKC
jgi:hypothetical protein